jgi:hypothetical protein
VLEEPKQGLPIMGSGAGSRMWTSSIIGETGSEMGLASRVLWVREQPVLEDPKQGLPMIGSGAASVVGRRAKKIAVAVEKRMMKNSEL